MVLKDIKKELFNDIEVKFKDKNFNYKVDDREQVCIHRILDSYVSYISVNEVKDLSDELGITRILELEKDYLLEFGDLTEKATNNPIDKLRLLLYFYFEQEYYIFKGKEVV